MTAKELVGFEPSEVQLECVFSGTGLQLTADYLVPITARIPNDELWCALDGQRDEFLSRGGLSLQRIGDCQAPGIVAAAVYAGHKAARELGQDDAGFKRDRVVV